MNPTSPNTPGRPRASSRETLAEAAMELFASNGYRNTSVDQITRLAGVSRNTFFNYFESKADVLWVDLDDALAHIPAALDDTSHDAPTVSAIMAALFEFTESVDTSTRTLIVGKSAWTVTEHDGRRAEQRRMETLAEQLATFVGVRENIDPASLEAQVRARLAVALLQAALSAWAAEPTRAGTLTSALQHALDRAVQDAGAYRRR